MRRLDCAPLCALAMFTAAACSSSPAPSATGTGGAGGSGGAEVGTGGSGGADTLPCKEDSDCITLSPTCHEALCYLGTCTVVPTPLGTQCGPEPWDTCDGLGTCGVQFPYGGPDCYAPKYQTPTCPTCDDGDPTTLDSCTVIGGLWQCANKPIPNGEPCGPWYVVHDGQCCPFPGTVNGAVECGSDAQCTPQECRDVGCIWGYCAAFKVKDGTPCAGGTCANGACNP